MRLLTKKLSQVPDYSFQLKPAIPQGTLYVFDPTV